MYNVSGVLFFCMCVPIMHGNVKFYGVQQPLVLWCVLHNQKGCFMFALRLQVTLSSYEELMSMKIYCHFSTIEAAMNLEHVLEVSTQVVRHTYSSNSETYLDISYVEPKKYNPLQKGLYGVLMATFLHQFCFYRERLFFTALDYVVVQFLHDLLKVLDLQSFCLNKLDRITPAMAVAGQNNTSHQSRRRRVCPWAGQKAESGNGKRKVGNGRHHS